MPGLSIIIPFRHQDERLETTLLSVLENRPADSEVIVVHDGSYRDPYALSDEVIFVEVEQGCGTVGLINAGVLAACSPVVNTVLDGTIVHSGWSESAREQLSRQDQTAAVAVQIARGNRHSYGLSPQHVYDAAELRAGNLSICRPAAVSASPELDCGFFKRKVLVALGGFNEMLGSSAAEVDFAWALDELQQSCVCDCSSPGAIAPSKNSLSTADLHQLACLAVAYGLTNSSWLEAATEILRAAIAGRPLAGIAWASGMLAVPRYSPAVRLVHAKERLCRDDAGAASSPHTPPRYRNAA